MEKQLAVFKENLEDFAKKHRKGINKDPEFRKNFVDMCAKIGVDPLACRGLASNSQRIRAFGPNSWALETSTTSYQAKLWMYV